MSFRVAVVRPHTPLVSETFLVASAAHLPFAVTVLEGDLPHVAGAPLTLPYELGVRLETHLRQRLLTSRHAMSKDLLRKRLFLRAFRRHRVDVVLAEYGTTAVDVLPACKAAGLPLVPVFHGSDATKSDILESQRERYLELFDYATSIVAVSDHLRRRLVALGAPAAKVVVCRRTTVDPRAFAGAAPERSARVIVAVGRFVEKKAPQLTILAFARALALVPGASLRMIGDGPLLGPCMSLVKGLGLEHAVAFLGAQPPEVVVRELQRARCFAQHSVTALNGDAEGTPVSPVEAAAAGLPIVATRHSGIAEIFRDGEHGILVEEHDVAGMSAAFVRLLESPELAGTLGRAARAHVVASHSLSHSVASLAEVLRGAVGAAELEPRPLDAHVCWFIQTYRDAGKLRTGLRRLRRVAPRDTVIVVSDGDDDPRLPAICAGFGATFVRGERLFGVESGGKVVERMLDLFLATRADYLVKIDPDSDVRHQLRFLPRRDRPLVCGTLQAMGTVDVRIVSIQGGCILMNRLAAEQMKASGAFRLAALQPPEVAWAIAPSARERARKGLTSYDWTIGWVAKRLGIPLLAHPEVHCVWKPSLLDHLVARRAAVSHPRLDLRRRLLRMPQAWPPRLAGSAAVGTYVRALDKAWRAKRQLRGKATGGDERPWGYLDATMRRAAVVAEARHVFGARRVPADPREAVVLCCVRNGETHVDAFVDHYTRLGFKHFFFLDNHSSDGTVARLRAHPHVTVWESRLAFSQCREAFKNFLAAGPGRGHWCMLADVDEHLLLPPGRALPELLSHLRRHGYTAVVTQMLDMFTDAPFESLERETGWSAAQFAARYRFYDLSDVKKIDFPWYEHHVANRAIRFHLGGVRARHLGTPGVWLTKESFFFSEDCAVAHAHRLDRARLADFSLPLLHYKFTAAFPAQVERAVVEKNYAQQSAEYVRYREALAGAPGLSLMLPTAAVLDDPARLWREGFVVGGIDP